MSNINYNDIQQQPDGKELMEMAELVQTALAAEEAATPTPSADEAWQRFATKHGIGTETALEPRIGQQPQRTAPRQQQSTLWRRWGIAASVALACMVVVAMSVPSVRQWVGLMPANGIEQSAPTADIAADVTAEVMESAGGVAFRNVPLSEVLQWVAENYSTQVVSTTASGHELSAASANDPTTELRLYVELDRGWTLQECIDFLNRFEQVNLTLTSDNVIVTE